MNWQSIKGRQFRPKQWLTVALCSSLVLGCGSAINSSERPRLADLPAFDRSILAATPAVNEQQLDTLYQQILALEPAPQNRQKILYRLSQMHTNQLERQELALDEERIALQGLVERYQQLLQDYPDDPNNELIRYQLARSYDLLGQQQACLEQIERLLQSYPDSEFASEVWFRKADIHYSRGEYGSALTAYQAVLQGKDAALNQHARYMLGWSYFKQQQFELADEQFLRVLEHNYSNILLNDQPQTMQSLREEVMRTLSVSLSYQQQGLSLQSLLRRVTYTSGQRPVAMVAELYQALARFLADKALMDASLQTYRLFIADYPHSYIAAKFQLLLIEHYLADANAEQALAAQREYIQLFGPGSAFWQQASQDELLAVQPKLLQYLDYFARAQYAKAMRLQGNARQQAFAATVPLWRQMQTIMTEPMLRNSRQVDDYVLADINFLLAESLAGAGEQQAALALYTELGFGGQNYTSNVFSAQDAAYKALLLSAEMATQSDSLALKHWQLQSDFVSQHNAHPAAQQVALQQLEQRYNEQDYHGVLQHSHIVTDWPVAALSQSNLVQEAQFLYSQSQLALNQYAAAEQSINALLAQTISNARRSLLTEQLASAIYQQAQQADTTVNAAQAHLQRLLTALPDSAYHEAAAFEQITQLRATANHQAVIPLLTAFIQRYPDSERGQTAKAQLLDSYEQAGLWAQAAAELTKLAASNPAPDSQREALYLAAQYYQRAGDDASALDTWRNYANRYPLPHALAQEARLQLVQLYQAAQDLYRQNYWRDKIAGFEQQYADQGNARTRQLAAEALLQLGRHESSLFSQLRLAHPLKSSLAKKRQHMSAAIKHYEASMQYGLAEILSEAQFQVAELYQQMAKALLQSDRPAGLDQMALEEYELLLQEQAYPFEEQAIAIYQQNTRLTQQQLWDQWIQKSFQQLAVLLPAKFDKTEAFTGVANEAN